MKKLMFLLALALISPMAYALYVGDPLSPEIPADGILAAREQPLELRLGYQGDWVWHRTFVSGKNDSIAYSSNSQLGSAALAIRRRFLVRLLAGATAADFTWRKPQTEQWHVLTHQNAAVGAAAQGIVLDFCNLTMSLFGAFQRSFLQIKSATLNGSPFFSFTRHGHLTEWHVGTGVEHRVGMFSPYAGLKVGNAYLNLAGNRWHARNKAGLVLGCSLIPYAAFVFHVEVRLFDENAATIAGEISF